MSNSDRERPTWIAYPVLADGTLGPGRQFAEATAWVKPGKGVADDLKLDVPTGNLNWGEDGSVLYIAADRRILRLRTSTRGLGAFWTGGRANPVTEARQGRPSGRPGA